MTTDILFHDVTFTYESGTRPLLDAVSLHFPRGWTGVVGANGAGKTTLMRLATGELQPVAGVVQCPVDADYCAQRTDDAPESFRELTEATDGAAWEIKGRLALESDWLLRWGSLSHGERKRVQLGVALWRQPSALAVDEPTNHLDHDATSMIGEALRSFNGVGILVSHDRELLDTLCQQCVFLDPPDATIRPGGYTQGAGQAQLEEETVRRERELATRELKRLERESIARRDEAARSDARISKRNLGKDNDARGKRNRARLTGKDAVGGKLFRQLDGRLNQARKRQGSIRVKKQYDLGIWVEGGCSKRDRLFELEAGTLALGDARTLTYPDLVMRPADRIAVTGPNGSGKSTLVREITGVLNLPEERVLYIPQEIDAGRSRSLLDSARALPGDQLGRMMTTVSCLGSRPERLLESELPSPGEVRKLLLAFGIARIPHLIIMDEPTNHLDLPSIECLEEALSGCPCGLLLVSHDERFLGEIAETRWDLSWVGIYCVFRSKVATRFGLKWPPNSEQSGHLFRSESGRFLAAAETGGRHVPK